MNRAKTTVLAIFLIFLLAIAVASQISSNGEEKFEKNKISVINDKITLEERQECATIYYNETSHTYGNVTRTRNTYGTCFNTTNSSYYTCINGTEQYQSYEIIASNLVLKSRDDCKSKNSFIVSVNKNDDISKKEIDFSNWGPCIQETQNNCLVVTCVSLYDGAHQGKFTNCNGGKSCQRFRICENEIKVFYKNSREDFVEYDPTFYLDELAIKEVRR